MNKLQPVWIGSEYKQMIKDKKIETGKTERRIVEDALKKSLMGKKSSRKLLEEDED